MRKLLFAALSAVSLTALSAQAIAGTAYYIVNANDTYRVRLTLCGDTNQVKVEGDGDTRLQISIEGGASMRVNDSGRDWTDFTIYQNGGSCRSYSLVIVNRGDVYNQFTVTLNSWNYRTAVRAN